MSREYPWEGINNMAIIYRVAVQGMRNKVRDLLLDLMPRMVFLFHHAMLPIAAVCQPRGRDLDTITCTNCFGHLPLGQCLSASTTAIIHVSFHAYAPYSILFLA